MPALKQRMRALKERPSTVGNQIISSVNAQRGVKLATHAAAPDE